MVVAVCIMFKIDRCRGINLLLLPMVWCKDLTKYFFAFVLIGFLSGLLHLDLLADETVLPDGGIGGDAVVAEVNQDVPVEVSSGSAQSVYNATYIPLASMLLPMSTS